MPVTQVMQCMEVWGGNQAVDSGVIMAGLDAWAYSRPWGGDAAGGDVHYVSSCASGRITRMLVADVSGHGNKVSETAGRLRQLMRRFVNQLDQSRFVAALNNEFGQLSQDGRFATAVVFTFFAPTNHVTISNAGHPPPLIWRARTRAWNVVAPSDGETSKRPNVKTSKGEASRANESDDEEGGQDGPANVPLGVLDMTRYDALTLRLSVGDIVMCYSDGLIECHDREGAMLGVDGLLQIVRAIDMSDASSFTPTLLKSMSALHEGNLCGDDVTIMLFRPNGLAPRLSLRERFAAMKRMIGAAGRALAGRDRFPWPDLSLPNLGGALFNPFNKLWRGR